MKIILILAFIFQTVTFSASITATVYYEWALLSYGPTGLPAPGSLPGTPTPNTDKFMTAVKFDPQNPRMIVMTPRLRGTVPYTLGVVPFKTGTNTTGPILQPFPYPSLLNQTEGSANCLANLQSVQDGDIDYFGRLWVVDTGRTNTESLDYYYNYETEEDTSESNNYCQPKLVLIDLQDNDKILLTYEFPDAVASKANNTIRAVQASCRDPTNKMNCIVYIANPTEEKLVIFDYNTNTSWSVQDVNSMKTIYLGDDDSGAYGIDGIALSPDGTLLYYSQYTGTTVYTISTAALQASKTNSSAASATVQAFATINSTDSMAMSSSGVLYYGPYYLGFDIMSIATNVQPIQATEIAYDNNTITWVNSFGFDGRASLFFVTNNYYNWISDNTYTTISNYRIMMLNGTGKILASNGVP